MKKTHKDCDLFQYVKDLREDAKLYKKSSNIAWKAGKYLEAVDCAGDSEILEWVADDLEYYLKHGQHR